MMRFGEVLNRLTLILIASAFTALAFSEQPQKPVQNASNNNTISPALFAELEELSRIVDISYCVGMSSGGIQKPFECLSRCKDFEQFELIRTWNTGPLLSDSCGYIAVSHAPGAQRTIVAFRGTYSLANTLADLSTVPQAYVPYPGDDDEHPDLKKEDALECANCTVHTGFYTSWLNARHEILPDVQDTLDKYPTYNLTLVGHSLGGAVAALASLDFVARGWNPTVTTFGEPRIGNAALNRYLENRFNLSDGHVTDDSKLKFRRVTHRNDPVPLLPLEEWGYEMHAGEIFIAKDSVPPENSDVVHCSGASDPTCIDEENSTGLIEAISIDLIVGEEQQLEIQDEQHEEFTIKELRKRWGIPARYKFWQLFFAHRDYFWRLGLCIPEVNWRHGLHEP